MQSQNVTRDLFDQGASSGVADQVLPRVWCGEAGAAALSATRRGGGLRPRKQDINGSVLGFFDTDKCGVQSLRAGPASRTSRRTQDCLKDDTDRTSSNYNGKVNYQLNSVEQVPVPVHLGRQDAERAWRDDRPLRLSRSSGRRAAALGQRSTSSTRGSRPTSWCSTRWRSTQGGGFNLIPQIGRREHPAPGEPRHGLREPRHCTRTGSDHRPSDDGG